jgi:hypothetical protein
MAHTINIVGETEVGIYGPQCRAFNFYILDGNGSIEKYNLPTCVIPAMEGKAAAWTVQSIRGCKISKEQLRRLFSEWREKGCLPYDLERSLGLYYDIMLVPATDKFSDTARTHGVAKITFNFSIIEYLWIYLSIWAAIGLVLIQKLWTLGESNYPQHVVASWIRLRAHSIWTTFNR